MPGDHPWREAALAAAGCWLLVDRDLRVMEASTAAAALFGDPQIPDSLVAVTRSAALEVAAKAATESGEGTAEVELAHFGKFVRLRAARVDDRGASILFFDDLTELRRLESIRSDFVANLAHELRTPIASLSLAVETLATGLAPDEQRRFIERIAEETRYIDGLLRSVSEMAVLEGPVRLNLVDCSLRDAVDRTWRRVTDRRGPVTLENSVDQGLVVLADEVRLLQILQNILENAHRFSPPGEAVVVGADTTPGEVAIWVQDAGPGIPPAELSRVFERFYKVDRARTRGGSGSGLGLAIAKHLVLAHGGQVRAAPGAPRGTRVTFTLPTTPSI